MEYFISCNFVYPCIIDFMWREEGAIYIVTILWREFKKVSISKFGIGGAVLMVELFVLTYVSIFYFCFCLLMY